MKKTQIRGGKNDKNHQNMVRNFKQIYEAGVTNKLKSEFKDLNLREKVKTDDQYLVNLLDVSPLKHQVVSENYD